MTVAHAVIAPIVLPLVAGAVLLLVERRAPRLAGALGLAATLALLGLAAGLLMQADSGRVQAYLLGNWRAPFGIALALDRLSALMLLLTAVVGTGALLYARGGDDTRGPHFHSLFQFQLMGLNGAFLTADLFNLFVFFEVLLAASYGLLLHGRGAARLKASLHYVAFNLTGSALFLVAVSLLYGLTGTLNLADLALRLPALPPQDALLAQAAGLMLLVVFGVKAALLPLYFWLPDTYASASAPVAALFAIMTKVGVYAIVRVTTLLFGASAGAVADLAWPVLPALAGATLALAAVGVLAARQLRALVAYLVVASAGTLLLAVGLGTAATLSAALFYLVNSTLVAAALFLLVDRVTAARGDCDALVPRPLADPARLRWATLFFVLAIAVAGVPPLAGFLGKALLLRAAGDTPAGAAVVAVVLAASLATMVALARAGSVVFWKPAGPQDAAPPTPPTGAVPHTVAAHHGALALLLAGVLGCALAAGPLSAYTGAAAAQLTERRAYVDAVLGLAPAPARIDVRREMRERGAAK